MTDLDECFRRGKASMERHYGTFENEPEDWEAMDGLQEQGIGGLTQSRTPQRVLGPLSIRDDDAYPEAIYIDADLVDNRPTAACKVLVHELAEWRAVEVMHSDDVNAKNTDYAASFVENHVCTDVNEDSGREICDTTFAQDYPTTPS